MITALVVAAATWSAPVQVPPDDGPWAAAPLTAAIEATTDGDLSHVWLTDGGGHEVPYRVVDTADVAGRTWRALTVVNRRRTAAGWRLEVEVPEGIALDALRLEMEGDGGVFDLRVLTGDDDGIVIEGVRLGRLDGTEVLSADLPPVDRGRLSLELDSVVAGLEPLAVSGRARLGPRRPILAPPVELMVGARLEGPSTSRWALEPVPEADRIDAIMLEISAPAVFRRQVTVAAFTGGESGWTQIGSATLERIPLTDGRPGLENLTIPIRPGVWKRLRLEEPLTSERPIEPVVARGRRHPRWILFPADADGLVLAPRQPRRSRTLEDRPPTVDLQAVVVATIGAPAEGGTPAGENKAPDYGVLVNLLFVVAALLLGLLAWKLLATRGG